MYYDRFDIVDAHLRIDALVEAATNARNVLEMNLDLFDGEESTDERDSYEEAATVSDDLRAALQPWHKVRKEKSND
jgi:hypothetical protein